MRANPLTYRHTVSWKDLTVMGLLELGVLIVMLISAHKAHAGIIYLYAATLGSLTALCAGLLFIFKPEVGLLAMVSLIPFEILRTISSYQSFTISKITGMVLILAVMLHYISGQKRESFLKSRQDILILLFVVSLFICFIPALNIEMSLDTIRRWVNAFNRENPVEPPLNIRFSLYALRGYITCTTTYLLITYLINSARLLRRFILALIISITLAAALANLGYIFKMQALNIGNSYVGNLEGKTLRAAGNMKDPNYFAAMVLMIIPFCFNYFIFEKRIWYKLLLLAACLNNIYAVILTFSRGGFVCLIITLLLLCIQHLEYFRKTLRFNNIFPLMMLVIFSLGATIILAPRNYKRRIFSISDPKDIAVSRRWTYIIVGVREIAAHPFLGIGPGNFPLVYANSNYGKYFSESSLESRYRQAHNTYIDIAAGCGLLSLPFFLLLFVTWRDNVKLTRHIKSYANHPLAHMVQSVQVSFISLLISGFFLTLGTHKNFWLLIAITVLLKRFVLEKSNLI